MSENKLFPSLNGSDDKSTEEQNSDLSGKIIFDTGIFAVDFSKGLRRFWYIVLIFAVLLGAVSGFLKKSSYVPMYSSSVSFSVTTISYSMNGSSVSASYYDNSSASQLSQTFPYIINTPMMVNALKNELNADYINGTISAEAVATDSNIFKVTVSSRSAQDAFNIVNAVIAVYPDTAKFVVGNIQLDILIKPTLPTEPYTSNNVLRTTLMMAAVGAVIGLLFIAVYALFRNTVRKKEDFKDKLNQKCLVEVPFVVVHRKSKDKKSFEQIIKITDKHPMFKESFRLLRKRLERSIKNSDKVFAVTSAAENEGKTTTSFNLASAFAIAGTKTALVDLDLIHRKLQRYFPEAENIKGFTDVLSQDSDNYGSCAFNAEKNLDIYFAGSSPLSLSDDKLLKFFDYLRSNYKYVIVNSTNGKSVSDVVSVGNLCDGIIFTVRQDYTSLDKIRKTLEYLSFSSAKIYGFVFNGVQDGFSGYGGYYYGGRYGYGKYGYGKYGYGRYGYGKSYGGYGKSYGYGGYGKGYGYGYGYGYGEHAYGEEDDENEKHRHRSHSGKTKSNSRRSSDVKDIPDSEIPDKNS